MSHGPRCRWVVSFAVAIAIAATARGQGIYAPAGGPINQAMAGASTAAPVDFGSSYWNPATLSFLERDEALIGSGLILPSIHFTSRVGANSLDGQFPPTDRLGTSRSDSGLVPGLAVGGSFRLRPDSPLTFGIGIFGLVGGGVNFAGSFSTPALGPRQPPNFFGLGPIYANTSILAIKPMASYQVSERLSLAFAPIITSGTVQFSPAFFAPGPVDRFGISTFPTATNSRPFWGGGFQLGAMVELSEAWNVGFSYTSPIWQEKWSYNTFNPDLSPRRIGIQAQIPAVYSWGVAFKGIPRTILDVDLRYLDYRNTALFGDSIPSGGLNWNSIFAVAVGGRYQLNDRIALLAGYLYNTLQIDGPETLFNIQAPGIVQHTLSIGTSLRLSEHIVATAGWAHGFRNDVEGPIAQIPGSSAKLDAQTDTFLAGLTIQYGAPRRPPPSPTTSELAALPALP